MMRHKLTRMLLILILSFAFQLGAHAQIPITPPTVDFGFPGGESGAPHEHEAGVDPVYNDCDDEDDSDGFRSRGMGEEKDCY